MIENNTNDALITEYHRVLVLCYLKLPFAMLLPYMSLLRISSIAVLLLAAFGTEDPAVKSQQAIVADLAKSSDDKASGREQAASARTTSRISYARESSHIGFVTSIVVAFILIAAVSTLTGIDYSGDSLLHADRCPGQKSS